MSRDLSRPPPTQRPTRAPGQKIIENVEVPPDDTLQGDFELINFRHAACGLQIHYQTEASAIVLWCTHANSSFPTVRERLQLNFDPSAQLHSYSLQFSSHVLDAGHREWSAVVRADGEDIGMVAGLPSMDSPRLTFSVRNKDNQVPPINPSDPIGAKWRHEVQLRDVRLPQPVSEKCRYGKPFVAGTNPVVAYSAAVFQENSTGAVVDWRVVDTPCIPCLHPCDHLVCDPACSDKLVTPKRLELTGLVLKPNVTYRVGVRATLANGRSAEAVSSGVLYDSTPPVVDDELPFFYTDVLSPYPLAPTNFSASTSVIRAVWLMQDPESMILEYHWAIGTSPGKKDVQDWTSTGELPSGTNSKLRLVNRRKYFVSVRATNNAGLSTLFHDTMGVTVLTDPPSLGRVSSSALGVSNFNFQVNPPDAKRQLDQSEVGADMRFKQEDSVDYYEICISSSENRVDDVLPCIPVPKLRDTDAGVRLRIRNHTISWNDRDPSTDNLTLSQLNPNSSAQITKNHFFLEPGKTIFLNLRGCSKSYVCSRRIISKQTVVTDISRVVQVRRLLQQQASGNVPRLQPMGNYPTGTAVYLQSLSQQQMKADYDSSAALAYRPYIVHPQATQHRTSRILHSRIQSIGHEFVISPVGRVKLRLRATRHRVSGHRDRRDAGELVQSLVYWHKDAQEWRLAGTFGSEDSVQLSVQEERMFASALISAAPHNSPPRISSEMSDTFLVPDGVAVFYKKQLQAVDAEGDAVTWRLLEAAKFGEAALTPRGLLTYRPTSARAAWSERLLVEVADLPGDGIPQMRDTGVFELSVSSSRWEPHLSLEPTGSAAFTVGHGGLVVTVEEKSRSPVRFAVASEAAASNLRISHASDSELQLKLISSDRRPPLHLRSGSSRREWLANVYEIHAEHLPHGLFSAQFVALAELNDTVRCSKQLNVAVAVLAMPCRNGGRCRGPQQDPNCTSARRASGFQGYECDCPQGTRGAFCQDADACAAHVCRPPLACSLLPSGQPSCQCPADTRCEAEAAAVSWPLAALCAAAAFIVCSVAAVALLRRRRAGSVGVAANAGGSPSIGGGDFGEVALQQQPSGADGHPKNVRQSTL